MKGKGNPPAKSQQGPGDLDWDHRILCSDGNCIGTIGVDGRCKECGRVYEGELPWEVSESASSTTESTVTAEAESPTEDMPESEQQVGNPDDSTADIDWENRRLCSDGNCIGVIGPDGKCKECGKPYED